MEALSMSSIISIAPRNAVKMSSRGETWKKRLVYCQSGNSHAIKSGGISTAVTESSPLIKPGSSVLSPNGKDLANPNGQSTFTVESHEEGIGVVKFLGGKTFLITGSTGFLGKVLVEKMLRTAPDVRKIYVLIKAKSRDAAVERLRNEVINLELFKRLKEVHGKSYQSFMMSKLIPVVGNVCEANLGIHQDVAQSMSEEVDVIINSAANTSFNERYDKAIDINTNGPARLMSFAKRCQKLKLFLQVSTAYVNGKRQGTVMEKPFCMGESIADEMVHQYGNSRLSIPNLNIEDEIKLAMESREAAQDSSVAQKMKELGMQRANKFGWQDTYVFTKAMGEMMIDSLREDIPVVVIRPSVIESTYKEPFPGWMEGNRMMDPIILQYGKGHLTGFLVDPNGVLDVVPADTVVNAILAAMAKHGAVPKTEYSVYQVASSAVNPLVFKELAKLLYEHFTSTPFADSSGKPVHVPRMKLINSMDEYSAHLWRQAINQTGLGALTNLDGKLSQKLESICKKSVDQAKYLASIYQPYTFYGGRFDNSNTKSLSGLMSEEERQQFGLDVESIDWKDYITNVHIPGLRRHVMKGRGLMLNSN